MQTHEVAPAFGASTPGEGLARAVVGGVTATAAVVAGFTAAGIADTSFLLLLGAAGLVGTGAAYGLERARPSTGPVARYAVLGAAVALGALVVLSRDDLAFALLASSIALPVGAAGGALAGVTAARLPGRWLAAAGLLGVVVLAGTAVVAVDRDRPALPGSYVLVEGPSSAGSAQALAARVAARLAAQPDPASGAAWQAVAPDLVQVREGGRASYGYASSGPVRRIEVQVDDARACVEVTDGRPRPSPGPCPQ